MLTRTSSLTLLTVGMFACLTGNLLAQDAENAAEDIRVLRIWRNSHDEELSGRLLDVNLRSAHILCDEKVYDIPRYTFSTEDQELLQAEYDRLNPKNVTGEIVTARPVPQAPPTPYDPMAAQREMEARIRQQREDQMLREQRWQSMFSSGGLPAYQAGQAFGYFSIIAVVAGLLYRFFRD